MTDFSVREFAKILEKLPEHLPISDAYAQFRGVDYTTWIYSFEREHMCAWFRGRETLGGGA